MKGAGRALGLFRATGLHLAGVCRAGERQGTVTFTIDINAPPGTRTAKNRFPCPTWSLDQTIGDLQFRGNHSNFSLAKERRATSSRYTMRFQE